MKKTDLCWLLGWPIYQLVGTARHELSHALVAALQGARITKIEILPSFQPHGFLWGYVEWTGGHTNALVTAAPYLCDFAMFLVFLPLCMLAVRQRAGSGSIALSSVCSRRLSIRRPITRSSSAAVRAT